MPDFPLGQRRIPVTVGKPEPEPKPAEPYIPPTPCDADPSCDRARFVIVVEGGAIRLCGHHFIKHRLFIMERGYQVIEI